MSKNGNKTIMNTIKNQEIIKGILSGDKETLKSFYKKNLPIVRGFIIGYNGTREDVEDIFQEALVLLYHKLKSGDLVTIESSIHSYFIGICKNKWKNQWRKQKNITYQELFSDNIMEESDSIIDTFHQKDKEQVFHVHMESLSANSKNLLQLFLIGKSMRDIARINGYTEGYTRKKKYYIKEHLIKMIQSDPLYTELMIG